MVKDENAKCMKRLIAELHHIPTSSHGIKARRQKRKSIHANIVRSAK
jgi:hypothetical protein